MREFLHVDRWPMLGKSARWHCSFRQPEERPAAADDAATFVGRHRLVQQGQWHRHRSSVRRGGPVEGRGRRAIRFGGLKGIAEAWGRSLDQDLGRGGYAAFRHLEAILRLTQYCEQNRPDYGAMTDEELERAIGKLGGGSETP
jgi:hypothetical protein